MINIQYKETTNNINRSVYSMRKQHIYPSKRRTFPRVNLLSRSVRTYNMKTNDTDELWKKILVLNCHQKLTADSLVYSVRWSGWSSQLILILQSSSHFIGSWIRSMQWARKNAGSELRGPGNRGGRFFWKLPFRWIGNESDSIQN